MSAFLYVKTYGCQMNVYDSAMIEDVMGTVGFSVVNDPCSADLIVLNTCHIREKAAEKLYSELGRLRKLKQHRDVKLVVAGCVAQAEGDEVLVRAPFVDAVLGPQMIHTLPEVFARLKSESKPVVSVDFPAISKFDALPEETVRSSRGISAYLSVQEGCDKFCTYCVVPYTRGAEFSRPVEDILAEAELMVRNGVKEITLLGQNVNAYHGTYCGERRNLGDLIMLLAKIDGLRFIRYTTSHPADMHDSLYAAHATESKLMPYLHLPVQSGSDRILKSMNRRHTARQYVSVVEKMRLLVPNIAFSSDFIVGFPGETDEDFTRTLELVHKVKFAQAYSFKYSARPGTPAAVREDQVPEDVKSVRLAALQKVLEEHRVEFNKGTVGSVVPVVFAGREGRGDHHIIGQSPFMQSVCVSDLTGEYIGTVRDVEITSFTDHGLRGRVLA